MANPGSGYESNGVFFRSDGQVEINNRLLHPDAALVRVFTDISDPVKRVKAIAEIKAHKVRHPYRQKVFSR